MLVTILLMFINLYLGYIFEIFAMNGVIFPYIVMVVNFRFTGRVKSSKSNSRD